MATLVEAVLDTGERRTLDRLVELLREEYGPDLHAVWLYGSRARGERTGPESDVDVMVVVTKRRRDGRETDRLLSRAAEEVHGNPWFFSVHSWEPAELARDRHIESFFLREVDRDRIVLFDDGTGRATATEGGGHRRPDTSQGRMKPRSERFMDMARKRLVTVRVLVANDDLDGAVEPAYYAGFAAARAALSEEDLYAKTHSGAWDLFYQTFVATGRFDRELAARARSSQAPRERSTYKGFFIERDEATEIVATAERFVAAVEAMLDD